MNITMSLTQLRALMVDAGTVAAQKALIEVGYAKPYLTKQEAYRKYGQSNVSRWIKERLIHPVRDGCGTVRWRIDATEIESVAKSANRHTFLNTDQR